MYVLHHHEYYTRVSSFIIYWTIKKTEDNYNNGMPIIHVVKKYIAILTKYQF
jgi:hypothetical protein